MSIDAVAEIPNVFEYTQYRDYLKDCYAYLKKAQPERFSFRYFSRVAGFASPNFLKLVMEGKRNLSAESTERFSKALKHSRDEARFFRALVNFNQARNPEERETCARSLFRSRKFMSAKPLSKAQYDYYSKWYFVAIRELVASREFREDPEWIAGALNPKISVDEAAEALDALKSLGMIVRDNGRWVQAELTVDTDNEVRSVSVANFHREMIRKAGESIERYRSLEREISSVTLGVSEENAKRIKELSQRFRKKILEICAEPQDVERIYQFNLQFFPLSEKLK